MARAVKLSDSQWRQVIETELYPLDWPDYAGGFSWSWSEKLNFTREIIAADCPLFPESLTLIAPLLIRCRQTALLELLREHISEAGLNISNDTIQLVAGNGLHDIISNAQVDDELAMAFSPLYQIFELRRSLRCIDSLQRYWQQEPAAQVSERHIELEALEALYLQNDDVADLQIAVKCNNHQMICYSQLSQAMGYYALLDPDPHLTANEHLPFERERGHLRQMRQLIGRSDMLQQDQIYRRQLERLS